MALRASYSSPIIPPASLLDEQVFRFDLPLSNGEVLTNARMSWRLLGDIRQPVILVLGGISADRKAWLEDGQGWWQCQIGPGKALDPAHYAILAIDYLGGYGQSSTPRNVFDAKQYPFPAIETVDQANGIAALLDHLGIHQLTSIVGSSYGGMVALAFAATHPERVKRVLSICASHQPWPMASAIRSIQRQVVNLAKEQGEAKKGMALARALAVTTYRSAEEFSRRFPVEDEGRADCAAYLNHCGHRFADKFHPDSFLCLSQSIDNHCVDPTHIQVVVDVLGFSSDQIVPPALLSRLYRELANPGLLKITHSLYGHDGFLKEQRAVEQNIHRHLEVIK